MLGGFEDDVILLSVLSRARCPTVLLFPREPDPVLCIDDPGR